MYLRLSELVFVSVCFHVTYSERRITDGKLLTVDKSYVVYLLKANLSTERFEDWLCGGTLVTTEFILTAAACLMDVHYLYAVAGYKKLISDKRIDQDDCTKQMKKRITFTCLPVAYEFDHRKLEKWSYIDIGLARVESPYDLNDATYQIICSYIPTTIPVNFDPKHQEAGLDALVMGWGHSEFWREHGDKKSQNNEDMRFAPTMIMDKEACKEEYQIYPQMVEIIDQFMICSLGEGNLDDNGHIIAKSEPNITSCGSKPNLKTGAGVSCEEENGAKDSQIAVQSFRNPEYLEGYTRRDEELTRRSGICQNDHGGPLVTWVGTREVVIGVASVFKVTDERRCVGPFLYTSTQCNGAFIDCVLNHKFPKKGTKGTKRTNESIARAKLCESPPSVRGFETFENYISWKHPAVVARQRGGRKRKHKLKQPESNDRFSKYNYQGSAGVLFRDRVLRHRKHKKHGKHQHRHKPKQQPATTVLYQAQTTPAAVLKQFGQDVNQQDNGQVAMRFQRPLH